MAPPYFCDCSHHNSDAPKHPIDWVRVRAAGVLKVYLKATESINFRDKAFPRDYPAAKAAGIQRAGYLFFRGDKSGIAQAWFFSDYVGLDRGDFAPAVDVEAGAAGVSKATYTQRLLECLQTVEALFSRRPVIYTSQNKWQELTTQPTWVKDFPLWLSAPDAPTPPLPTHAVTWAIHQYSFSGAVSGIDGDVDLNRENAPPPEPPPPDGPDAAAIRAHAVAILGLV